MRLQRGEGWQSDRKRGRDGRTGSAVVANQELWSFSSLTGPRGLLTIRGGRHEP